MLKTLFPFRRFIFLLPITLLTSILCNAQIEVSEGPKRTIVGSFKNGATLQAELAYEIEGNDTLYSLMFSDLKYQTIMDYKFILFYGQDGTVEVLYSILKSFFEEENKKNKDYKKELKLGGKDVVISNVKGSSSIMFYYDSGYFYLTEKQLNKLFGK